MLSAELKITDPAKFVVGGNLVSQQARLVVAVEQKIGGVAEGMAGIQEAEEGDEND